MEHYETIEYIFRVILTFGSVIIAIVLAIINYTSGKKQNAMHKRVREYVSSDKKITQPSQSRLLALSLKILVLTNSKTIIEAFTHSNDKSNANHDTIIEIVLYKKIIRDTKSYLVMGLTVLLLILVHLTLGISQNYIIIPILIIFLLYVSQLLVSYRVKKGWYGNNSYEALEILKYINDYKNKDDFFDGNSLKKIFPNPELKNTENSSILGGIINEK
jgi:hypothetical protein